MTMYAMSQDEATEMEVGPLSQKQLDSKSLYIYMYVPSDVLYIYRDSRSKEIC